VRTEKKTSYFPKYFAKIDYLSHDRCAQLIDSFLRSVILPNSASIEFLRN